MENKKHKILIVDDDNFLLNMYSVKFTKAGHEVILATGSLDALEKLRNGLKPKIIITDIIMPSMDGIEFFTVVGKEKLAEHAVKIVLTNQGQPSEIERAKAIGVSGYIVKASSIPTEVLDEVMKIYETYSHPSANK